MLYIECCAYTFRYEGAYRRSCAKAVAPGCIDKTQQLLQDLKMRMREVVQ